MLRARKDQRLSEAEVSLDTGGLPLRLKVRDPSVADPSDPADSANADAGGLPDR